MDVQRPLVGEPGRRDGGWPFLQGRIVRADVTPYC